MMKNLDPMVFNDCDFSSENRFQNRTYKDGLNTFFNIKQVPMQRPASKGNNSKQALNHTTTMSTAAASRSGKNGGFARVKNLMKANVTKNS